MEKRQRLTGVWIVAAIALIANAAIALMNVVALIRQERQVLHTRDVQSTLNEWLRLAIEAETGQRGYIINRDPQYLEPYERTVQLFPVTYARLEQLVSDNPDQRQRLREAERVLAGRQAVLDDVINVTKQGGDWRTIERFQNAPGKKLMDVFRKCVSEMTAVEETLAIDRSVRAERLLWLTIIAVVVGSLISLGVILLAYRITSVELIRRLEAESSVRRINDHLEATVAARTNALQQTSAELLRSNNELEKFAYIASHDLQEPLRKIQAFGDRLQKKAGPALDDSCRDYLARMQNASSRMRTLIDDLLTFSRVSTKPKAFGMVDLNEIVREVLSSLESRIEETQARMEIGPLPTLHADPAQMKQLFQNLIGNALKFKKPDQPPTVTVRALPAADLSQIAVPPPPTTGWRFTVKDNGIGFDSEYSDRIFELFQRLHGRAEFEGTGIGLSIARKIVERHGGQIRAFGRPGVGAEFQFDLPDPAAGAL